MKRGPKPRALADRFWPKVDKAGPIHPTDPALGRCWLWTATTSTRGYGRLRCGDASKGTRRMVPAHRIALALEGAHVPDHLLVRHSCDRPLCVNPLHLLTGTVQDNSDDMVVRGRSTTGVRNASAKIVESDVQAIRSLRKASDLTYSEIGNKFGLGRKAVSQICRHQTWTHIA